MRVLIVNTSERTGGAAVAASRLMEALNNNGVKAKMLVRDKESIFDLIMMDGNLADIHVREKKGADPLPEKDKRTAEEFIRKYHKNIIQKWVKFFVLKQSVRSTRINKKL